MRVIPKLLNKFVEPLAHYMWVQDTTSYVIQSLIHVSDALHITYTIIE